jgi:hypothetical protein
MRLTHEMSVPLIVAVLLAASSACGPTPVPGSEASAGDGAGGGAGGGTGGGTGTGGGQAVTGPSMETIATGLQPTTDLELDAANVYLLLDTDFGAEIRRCALSGCGANSALVVSSPVGISSMALHQGRLFVTDGERLSTCTLSAAGTCTLATWHEDQGQAGPFSEPNHLVIANDRVYWISGDTNYQLLKVCPLTGCSAGYPKIVYSGALFSNLTGIVVTATDVYSMTTQYGLVSIPLTTPETSNPSGVKSIAPSLYGFGPDLEGTTLLWPNYVTSRLESCVLPACTPVTQLTDALVTPSGVKADATHVYGINRGSRFADGTYIPSSATVWRYRR